MQNALVTTGLIPLTVNSVETFQIQASIGSFGRGAPWDLTGGTVNLILADPNGATQTFAATIVGKGAQFTWTVLAFCFDGVTKSTGTWLRTWDITAPSPTGPGNIRQVSRPTPFTVISSPV